LRAKDSRIFLHELGTLYRSGVPLQEGLESLARSPHTPTRTAAERLGERISRGASLSESLGFESFLPPECVAIVEAAERSGQVPQILLELGNEMERRQRMRDGLIARLIYPCAIYALVVLLPPLYLLISGQYGEYLLNLVYGFAPVLLGGGLFFVLRRQFRQSSVGRRTLEGPLLAIPVIGSTWLRLALGRSLGLLGLLLQSGLTLRESFEHAEKTAVFHRLAKGFHQAAAVVEGGGTLADAMSRVRDIPDLQQQQIATGERSGTMDEALQRCGNELTESAFKRLDGLLKLAPIVLYLVVGYLVFRKMAATLGGL
jgi:type II secretory pathway component PulF